MQQPLVHVFYPTSFWGGGPPETCYRICSHWPAQGLTVRVHAAACLRGDPTGIMATALPSVLPMAVQRKLAAYPRIRTILQRRSAAQALAAVRPGDLCYFWPGAETETIAAAKARGGRIVLEFINTHVSYAQRILDAECARIGAPRYSNFTESGLASEVARVQLADAIFAPGPFVERSIRDTTADVPPILPASYGTYLLSEPVLRGPIQSTGRPLRFLFVGSVGLRKGAHILMEAWRMAALPAELWITGAVEPHIATPEMRQRFLGHVKDIGQIYREVDVFVFPSLEEGGPQVTYEAAAYGLPLIVTPMGGGWIAKDGVNALLVPPADSTALAEALTRLHSSEELRLSLGAQALADVSYYSWEQVADRRRRTLLEFAMP